MRRNTTMYRTAKDAGFGNDVRASMGGKDQPQDGNYIATSPTAGYSQGRNVRNIEKKLSERDSLVERHQQNMMHDDNEDFIANASDANTSTQWSGR